MLWLIIQLIFLAVLAVVILYLFGCIREYMNPMRKIPGPSFTDPIFGALREFHKKECTILEFSRRERHFGKLRKAYLMNGEIRLVVVDSYWMKHIMVTNARNYKRGNYIGAECIYAAVGDNGLIVVSGEKHKRLRKSASPAFKLSTIKKLMPFIEMCGERLKNLLSQLCKNTTKEVEMKDVLNKVTLDVIGLIAFGHDFKESCTWDENTFGSELRQWFDWQDLIVIPLPRPMIIVYAILKICKYLPKLPFPMIQAAQTTNRIHHLVDCIVSTKVEQRKNKKGVNSNESDKKSLLDFILDSSENENVDPQEVHDLLMTFLIAGHETSSLAVTWTLYLLSKNVEAQIRCREEIQQFFEKREKTSDIEWHELKDIKFLNAVINESLRLFPPVPWVNRISLQEEEIGPYRIPAGIDHLLLIVEMQRDPEYWPNPEEFLPERFLEPDESIPWHAFMPFSDGVHKCIGYQLALTEITSLLVVLLKNFIFSIDPNTEYREFAVITMQPNPPLKLFVKHV